MIKAVVCKVAGDKARRRSKRARRFRSEYNAPTRASASEVNEAGRVASCFNRRVSLPLISKYRRQIMTDFPFDR